MFFCLGYEFVPNFTGTKKVPFTFLLKITGLRIHNWRRRYFEKMADKFLVLTTRYILAD